MSDKADKLELADAIDINKIMRQATRAAEKQAELSPVFLKRDSFAGSAVSTGSLCVDKMMGGGIPACRIVGISGPERAGKTLFGTQIGYNQVKNRDGFFVLLDAEGSTDPIFLAARGIDYELYKGRRNKSGDLLPEEVDYVYLYQPSTVEQIVNYIHTISASLPENRNPKRPVCIYSLDSVVALITNEIDGNLYANKMTMHARSYATYLPVINSDLVKSGSSMIYMNQLRQRPGVAYGCLQGDTLINFVDGRCYPIREIVENKIEGEVWSHTDGKIHPAKITNWYDNGTSKPKDWIHIWTEGPGSGNGIYTIVVTKNHKVLKSNGEWVEAQHIVKDDELVTKYQKTFEEGSIAEQFLVGTLIGDSCVPKNQRNKDILMLMNNEQIEYQKWKVDKLKDILKFNFHTIKTKKGKVYDQYISQPDVCLGVITKDVVKRNPQPLHKLTWLSIAVWFMDDGSGDFNYGHFRGHIHFKRLRDKQDVLDSIEKWFRDNGIEGKIAKDKRTIEFAKDAFIKLSDKIAEYIPECMQYKLPETHRGRYKEFNLEKGLSYASLPVKVTKVKEGLGHRYNRKYDIEVEGTHNYVAGHSRGGLVVHNSPIYEPAGDALKFFSSIRLMLSTTKPKEGDKDHPFLTKEMIPGVEVKEGGVWEEPHLDSSGNVVGMDRYIYTGVKTVKNKVFTPYQKCWVRIQFEENGATGHGLDPVFDVFNFLSDAGYIVPQVKEGKKRSLKGVYATKKCDQFNPVEELDMPSSFDYYEFKSWVNGKSDLVSLIRDKLLVSGIVYTKEEKDTFELIKKESEEELEALADCEDMDEAEDAVEEVEKKKRGRKPKSS